MKAIKKFKWLWVGICLVSSLSLHATHNDPFEMRKEINKSFHIEQDVSLEVSNKYGNLHFDTWDVDSVSFDIEIIARGNRMDNIQDIINSITVDFNSSPHFLQASTMFASSKGILGNMLTALLNDQQVFVNYTVKMPHSTKLRVTNRFGNVYIPSLKKSLRVDIQHGSLRAREIKKGSNIDVEHGDIEIEKFGVGDIKIHFGDLEIEEAEELHVDSKVSNIEISKVDELHLDAFQGKIRIDEVNRMEFNSNLASLKITELSGMMTGEVKLAKITIRDLKPGFQKINITPNLADIFIESEENTGYKFSINLSNNKQVTTPAGATLEQDSQTNDGLYRVGQKGTGQGVINIHGKNSSAHLK